MRFITVIPILRKKDKSFTNKETGKKYDYTQLVCDFTDENDEYAVDDFRNITYKGKEEIGMMDFGGLFIVEGLLSKKSRNKESYDSWQILKITPYEDGKASKDYKDLPF